MTLNKIGSTSKKISFNVPTYLEFLPPLKLSNLTPTEQKVYLQLSLEYQIVMENAPSFQMGAYKWNKLLPERLEMYGITFDEWERISTIGDDNDEIQDQLSVLVERLEKAS